jgi:methionyl aminopeptidase
MESASTPLPPDALRCLREAGRVAAAVREMGTALVRPGRPVREVCEAVETEIVRRGGQPAFPVQSSRNEVAAHYCPGPEDDTRYADGDLAKLDIGVHVDGWVVDTALTVNVGDRPENRPLVQAVEEALEAAIAAVEAGVTIRRVSTAIRDAIRRRGLTPVKNLCGHGVGRWTVHRPPPIPNVPDQAGDRLRLHAVVAIEPFATAGGPGVVGERGRPEVFRLDPARLGPETRTDEVMAAIRAFRGLPFARRQLAAFPRGAVERALDTLAHEQRLQVYPPLVEADGRGVAQAEHTIYVGTDGVEVLTR